MIVITTIALLCVDQEDSFDMTTFVPRLCRATILTALSASLWATSAIAIEPPSETAQQSAPRASQLIRLPHPMRMVRADPGRFGITAEQAGRLQKELHDVYSLQMRALMPQAAQLEETIRTAILSDGRYAAELAADSDRLAALKREILNLRNTGAVPRHCFARAASADHRRCDRAASPDHRRCDRAGQQVTVFSATNSATTAGSTSGE